ncbi:hypothetical protein G7054_g10741 [Neopestalotiopsis clavispora]|nr:hypothetical protein G7054_g10741 [Neopestalotiopsis clavispora]
MNSAEANDLGDTKVTDRFDLSKKNFLITGGGRGIGFACVKAIAQLGGGVAVIDSAPEPVPEFHALGKRYGIPAVYVQGDVTDQTSLEEAFAHCVQTLGRLHGALTAAGICVDKPLLEADWESTQQTLNVNIVGTFWVIKLLARHFVDEKIPGSIVAISSMNGQGLYVPVQPQSSYNASKAAIKGLVGPLAGELGQYGIRVNSISPGAIRTPLLARLEGEKRAILDWYQNGAPLQRLGVPEDLTPMVCYLLSDASAFTTGADMLITEYRALLGEKTLTPAPPATDLSVIRATINAATEAASNALPFPAGMTTTVSTVTSTDGTEFKVTRFVPLSVQWSSEKSQRAVIYGFGGGLIAGSVDINLNMIAQFAEQTETQVFAPDYRLAPEHPYPAALQDVYSTITWLQAHAGDFRVDPARIVSFGQSAGGNLMASAALQAKDESLSPPIAALVLRYPMLDDRTQMDPADPRLPYLTWSPSSNAMAWGAYLGRSDKTGGQSTRNHLAIDTVPHTAAQAAPRICTDSRRRT